MDRDIAREAGLVLAHENDPRRLEAAIRGLRVTLDGIKMRGDRWQVSAPVRKLIGDTPPSLARARLERAVAVLTLAHEWCGEAHAA